MDLSGLEGGRARFTCRECNYLNSYPLPWPEHAFLEKSESICKEMLSFPEVIGLFLYHSQRGILLSRMPAILKQADLNTLGREFSRAYSQSLLAFSDVHGMQIRIAEKYFIVHQIRAGFFLVIVSRTPSLSRELCGLIPGLAESSPVPGPDRENS